MISIIQNMEDINAYCNASSRKELELNDRCPICNRKMHGHGCYFRSVLIENGECVIIAIYRHRCPSCGGTVSHLPAFLMPYHSLKRSVISLIVDLYKSGMASIRCIAQKLIISRATVQRYLRLVLT